jgi:hypothetical protein
LLTFAFKIFSGAFLNIYTNQERLEPRNIFSPLFARGKLGKLIWLFVPPINVVDAHNAIGGIAGNASRIGNGEAV